MKYNKEGYYFNPRRKKPVDPLCERYDLPWEKTTIVFKRELVEGKEIRHFNFVQAVIKHSPTGMTWGYMGSGPADMAINILYRATGDIALATDPRIYQDFKNVFVAAAKPEGDSIMLDSIGHWLALHK